MATDYLLKEDGFKLILEDASGDLILESSTPATGGIPTLVGERFSLAGPQGLVG